MSMINKAHGLKGKDSKLETPFYGLVLKIAEKIEKDYSTIKKDFRSSIPGFNENYGDLVF